MDAWLGLMHTSQAAAAMSTHLWSDGWARSAGEAGAGFSLVPLAGGGWGAASGLRFARGRGAAAAGPPQTPRSHPLPLGPQSGWGPRPPAAGRKGQGGGGEWSGRGCRYAAAECLQQGHLGSQAPPDAMHAGWLCFHGKQCMRPQQRERQDSRRTSSTSSLTPRAAWAAPASASSWL